MTNKKHFRCANITCGYETHKLNDMYKHLRLSKHKDGVTVNDYVWREDKLIFSMLLISLLAVTTMLWLEILL